MRIAVLGGGNGAHAAVADLAEQGHEVRWWRRDAAALGPFIREPVLELLDHRGSRHVRFAGATTDMGDVLAGADLVLAPVPAFAQDTLAQRMAPHLRPGQVVFFPPGTFGSVLVAKRVRELGNDAPIAFAEAGTLPWLTRKRGPSCVAITTRATRLPTGVFPQARAEAALAVLKQAFPAIEPCGDALSAALLNAGPIIHPPLVIMNAAPLEHFERWDIHNEGTQPAVRRVTDQLDAERMALRQALGYGPPHFPLRDHYEASGEEWMYGNLAHERLTESGHWRERIDLRSHRYVREDIALGLSFLTSVARWAGVPAPLAEAFLTIGSAICGEDFARSGRTLESLGLAGLDRAGMQRLLQEGFT